ncbi:hypothetical protein CLV47_11365 [Antricoccus suffuscus]|uniref:Uncharacterized protein n=1 Tax=Antricoccus suffuscus TaxID=1629062 RepID=A0A2T0ZX26_9ACTN|nr:hypothetical protein [Antricoccus suffuscus]PRZ40900.1 hypothetical protein CLV47_11365 [Antricoccus suffuscus]
MAGNLGGYQVLVTVVKKLGGPATATAAVATALVAVGSTGTLGAQKIIQRLKGDRRSQSQASNEPSWIEVVDHVANDNGITLEVGARFRVIATTDDTVVIEIEGHKDNPHVVAGDYLASISAFEASDAAEPA